MKAMIGWLVTGPIWLPLDVPPRVSSAPVYPAQGNGFAASIVGAFVVLGVLVLFMVWISRKPQHRRHS